MVNQSTVYEHNNKLYNAGTAHSSNINFGMVADKNE